jgi:tetratricopeptide (TPR) repeat protein
MTRRNFSMQRFLLVVGVLILFVSAGCSGRAGSEEATQNANVSTEVSEFTDANLALAEGIRFLDTGETDKAIDALSQAVKLDPDLAEAWFRLGIAYALAEKRDAALEKTDSENVDESPSSAKKSSKPNSEKAFEKAVAAYKKLIAANEENHAAHFNLGRAYNKLNEDEDAAKALKQAVKLNPEDTEYQTELGAILIKLAQYQEAIPPLKKALELDPDNLRAQDLLEDAEAGRSRVNYAATPKDEKKKPGDNSASNSNTAAPPVDSKTPPPVATPAPPRPRPSASRAP